MLIVANVDEIYIQIYIYFCTQSICLVYTELNKKTSVIFFGKKEHYLLLWAKTKVNFVIN